MVKRTTADDAFSKVIRFATDYKCEKCGKQYEHNSRALHCSHYFGRRSYGTRFDPNNAFAHCHGCHKHFSANPYYFTSWVEGKIGEGAVQILREKKEDIGYAKTIKKNLPDVARHYRDELERLRSLRMDGATGKLKIIGY